MRPEGDLAVFLGSLCQLDSEPDLRTLYAFEFVRTESIPLLGSDEIVGFAETLGQLLVPPATVEFWLGCRRFRLLVGRGVAFDRDLVVYLAQNAKDCESDDLVVGLFEVLSRDPTLLADFGDPFLESIFSAWTSGDVSDTDIAAFRDLVSWLYLEGFVPIDHFGNLWVASLATETVYDLPHMAIKLVAARVSGIERLLPLSLPFLRPALAAGNSVAYEDVLGIAFVIAWSFPTEMAAWPELHSIVDFIWECFNGPELVGGEDIDFYLMSGTVAALIDARLMDVPMDEMRGRALGWIMEADPVNQCLTICGAICLLIVCCRDAPEALAQAFWVTEKLGMILDAGKGSQHGYALIAVTFAMQLIHVCPEHAVELVGLALRLVRWAESGGVSDREVNVYLRWMPPLARQVAPAAEDLEAAMASA
jgi:hypothetical protein